METFTAANVYSGITTIDAGTALILSGQGSVAASSGVVANGGFGIADTAAGAAITTLSGNGVVGLGARTLTLTAASGTFSGLIGDSGGLTVTGGTETLTGANTYTGATIIGGGARLNLAGAGSIAPSSGVVDEGTFDIAGTASGAAITSLSGGGAVALGGQTLTLSGAQGTFSGSIAGTGGIAVLGGSLALTGISTYSGGTLISAANLSVSSDAALGSASLAMANGQLTALANVTSTRAVSLTGAGSFNTNLKTISLNGVVSGTGALIAAGGGTLVLTAVNTYSGGTIIIEHTTLVVGADSTLGAASGVLDIIDGKLQASADFSSTRSIVIGPNGAIDANGHTLNFGGPITLGSDSGTPLFTGSANVAGSWTFTPQGGLVVSGTLQGVGTVSQQTTIVGTLSPGNSPGTITFTAPVTMVPASTLALDIDGTGTGTGAGNYDRVVVQGAGNTFTANGQMVVKLRGITGNANNTYTPPVGQRFNVVHTDAGVSGSFASLVQPATGLAPGTRFDTIYSAADIDLVAAPASYASLGVLGVTDTANRHNLGSTLDAYRPAPGVRAAGDRNPVLAALYTLPVGSIGGAMDQMAGTVHGDALSAALAVNRMFNVATDTHRGGGDMAVSAIGRLPYGDFAAINAPASPRPASLGTDSPFWALGVGAWSATAADGNAPGYRSTTGGIVVGLDLVDRPGGRLGVAAGYARAELENRSDATARVQSERLVAYGSLIEGRWRFDGEVAVAADQFSSTRSILMGLLNRIAKGNSNGWAYAAAAGAHYGDGPAVPFAEMRYDYVNRAAFTETGAGDLALDVGDARLKTPRARIGVDVDMDRLLGDVTGGIALNVQLAWAHDFSSVSGRTDASLVGLPGAPFTAFSSRVGADAAIINIDSSVHIADTISLFGEYHVEARHRATSQTALIGLRANW
jgi:fibronectin-binding autotransporter adhesin